MRMEGRSEMMNFYNGRASLIYTDVPKLTNDFPQISNSFFNKFFNYFTQVSNEDIGQ